MKKRIKDIAHVQTGIYIKPSYGDELVYLQSKNFDEFGQIESVLYPELYFKDVSENHLLRVGDVLFSAKGNKNFAFVFEAHHKASVASTSFFVIRLNSDKIIPKYLAWFLNSGNTQNYIKSRAKGTAMLSVSKKVLENIEIPIPNIEKQEVIIKITELLQKEKYLKTKIETLREKHIEAKLLMAIK